MNLEKRVLHSLLNEHVFKKIKFINNKILFLNLIKYFIKIFLITISLWT